MENEFFNMDDFKHELEGLRVDIENYIDTYIKNKTGVYLEKLKKMYLNKWLIKKTHRSTWALCGIIKNIKIEKTIDTHDHLTLKIKLFYKYPDSGFIRSISISNWTLNDIKILDCSEDDIKLLLETNELE